MLDVWRGDSSIGAQDDKTFSEIVSDMTSDLGKVDRKIEDVQASLGIVLDNQVRLVELIKEGEVDKTL